MFSRSFGRMPNDPKLRDRGGLARPLRDDAEKRRWLLLAAETLLAGNSISLRRFARSIQAERGDIHDLMSAHWREAEDAADNDGKFTVAFKATFDRGAPPTKLKVTCRIAKTISDEIESEIEDPRQQKLL